MRTVVIAGLGLAALAGQAGAQGRVVVQGPGARYPVPGATVATQPTPAQPMPANGPRWGSKVDGRWWAAVNAPGGLGAYRRPARGVALPPYWTASRFYVSDWASYGLPQPPVGHRWVRYYDDAVLVDERGTVLDSEFGVDWDRFDRAPGLDAPPVYAQAPYAPPNGSVFDPRSYPDRPRDGGPRDSGLGGAAAGAVAGGILGATVAGRGDRLGGALIGAGVGAATGYAVDKLEDRGRRAPPPPPGYGAAYPPPVPSADGYASGVQSYTVPAGGAQTIYVGPGVTTVTVTTQPAVTTTTTTEYYDDAVTYVAHPRRARRAVRTKTVPRCRC